MGVVTAVLIITYTIPPPPLHHFIQCTPDATTLYTVYILHNEARTMYKLINDQLINGWLVINGWIMIGAIWLPNNPVSTCGAINHLVLPRLTPEGLNLLNISSYPQYDDLMKGMTISSEKMFCYILSPIFQGEGEKHLKKPS